MKTRYDIEEDILMIKVSDESIDYAEEVGPIIVHFTRDGKPVLLEIMDASEFLTDEFLDEARRAIIDFEHATLARLVTA